MSLGNVLISQLGRSHEPFGWREGLLALGLVLAIAGLEFGVGEFMRRLVSAVYRQVADTFDKAAAGSG